MKFIDAHHDQPFFLYVPHTMPHVPLGVSRSSAASRARGIYGDVIEEIDWSVGEILAALDRHGLNEQTLVMFASDNGPWLVYGDHAGGRPLTRGEGNDLGRGRPRAVHHAVDGQDSGGNGLHRVGRHDRHPADVRGPGRRTVDPERIIDGKDIRPLLFGEPGAKCPHEAYYYYWNRELQAVRSGPWKLHFPHTYPSVPPGTGGTGGNPARGVKASTNLVLYNLEADVGETTDVSARASRRYRPPGKAGRDRSRRPRRFAHQAARQERPSPRSALELKLFYQREGDPPTADCRAA